MTEENSVYESTPTGDYEGSGWQFQGKFNSFLGTPIAPHHFITARHIGGAVGNKFYFSGQEYSTIAKKDLPGTDLRLWEVNGTFETYAPLYEGGSEVGKELVVIGRGVDRGDAVTQTIQVLVGGKGKPVYEDQVITNGWKWGAYNHTQRWGVNSVHSIYDDVGQEFLVANWDQDGGDHEAMLTDRDSGGAVFIKEGELWTLAGINSAIGPGFSFSLNADGSDWFNGSILDFQAGVYDTNGVLYSESLQSSFFSSRISSSYDWITSNIPDFDTDVDGLPDWWELKYGGDALSMERDGHLDSDGFTNYEEWITDTDPVDPDSRFFMEWNAPSNVVFSSSSNRWYLIESRDELTGLSGNWIVEKDWFPGTGHERIEPIMLDATNQFFRARSKVR